MELVGSKDVVRVSLELSFCFELMLVRISFSCMSFPVSQIIESLSATPETQA